MALHDLAWIASDHPFGTVRPAGRPPLAGVRSRSLRGETIQERMSRRRSIAPSRRWPRGNMAPAGFVGLVAIWLAAVSIILGVALALRGSF